MRIIILLGLCVNAEALLAEIPLAISKKAPGYRGRLLRAPPAHRARTSPPKQVTAKKSQSIEIAGAQAVTTGAAEQR
jgi:hypothetical protein